MSTSHTDDIDENYVIASPSKKPKDTKQNQSLFGKKRDSSAADDKQQSGTDPESDTKTGTDTNIDSNANASNSDNPAEGASDDQPKKRGLKARIKSASRKRLITCGVIVVVVLGAAGIGFWTWHETPSFCGAICHSPMDPYLPTYYSEPGQSSTDKWGNTVSDSSSMLSATHREYADATCMSCHIPSIQEQVTEGLEWVVGNYYYPLNERNFSRLVYYRGVGETEFCMNKSCHNLTKDELTDATSESTRNPHSWHHSEYTCSDCHKAHRASVMICSQCHDDYTLPDGWITYQESKELETTYGQYADLEGESGK